MTGAAAWEGVKHHNGACVCIPVCCFGAVAVILRALPFSAGFENSKLWLVLLPGQHNADVSLTVTKLIFSISGWAEYFKADIKSRTNQIRITKNWDNLAIFFVSRKACFAMLCNLNFWCAWLVVWAVRMCFPRLTSQRWTHPDTNKESVSASSTGSFFDRGRNVGQVLQIHNIWHPSPRSTTDMSSEEHGSCVGIRRNARWINAWASDSLQTPDITGPRERFCSGLPVNFLFPVSDPDENPLFFETIPKLFCISICQFFVTCSKVSTRRWLVHFLFCACIISAATLDVVLFTTAVINVPKTTAPHSKKWTIQTQN